MELIEKYDVQVPRYTSYPPITMWRDNLSQDKWLDVVKRALEIDGNISMYIHLPYCESLCTYCGCNKHITKNHDVEHPYIECLLKEFAIYKGYINSPIAIQELHFGGGTPTFFSPDNLVYLVKSILEQTELANKKSFSFESHPSNTTEEHLEKLASVGFDRISIGVQDFDEHILKVINRFQTKSQIINLVSNARKHGYQSINFDLIFGLPFQTVDHIYATMDEVSRLKPDRIAFYGYAHVPWTKPSQRAYDETSLPKGEEKRLLYEKGKESLQSLGYVEIGMDHFALPTDSLYKAWQTGNLHRNFMGYTDVNTSTMIGLGASAISDVDYGYLQNEKNIALYQAHINKGLLPIIKSHHLTKDEVTTKKQILDLMCFGRTEFIPSNYKCINRLNEMQKDGLLTLNDDEISLTEAGQPFVRNVCAAIDPMFSSKTNGMFSKAI